MILWVDGSHDPAENMRRDTALLAAAEGGAEPVLRLFAFAPPGITLGMNQRPERELDLARCTADGIPWARRPTGGRAIFHAEEWTYSLAAPLDDAAWGGTQAQGYARTSGILVASLNRLGVPATFAPGAARAQGASTASGGRPAAAASSRRGGAAAAPCFASTARHEVVLANRKLAGSAQRRTARARLQQGSLLLGEGHLRLADYLAVPGERRGEVREALRLSTAHAGTWLGTRAPLEHWADALMAVLPPGTRRLDDASGAFLLTLSERGSYTPAFSSPAT